MMNARIALVVLAAGALLSSACSLLVDFDPEGQPCGELGECLEGYGCVDGVCVSGAAPAVDCSRCPAGGCVDGTNECLPNTCEYKICPATYRCEEDPAAGPQCRPVPVEELGASCFDDSGCTPYGANRVCLRGAVQTQASGGGLRSGVCVEPCVNDTCTTPGATCRSFDLGAGGVTKVCLPDNTLTPCVGDGECARGELVCTVFDNAGLGALTACDTPLADGAGIGEACVVTTGTAGGALCANGLCIPRTVTPERPSTCGELCVDGNCTRGLCELVEFNLVGAVRFVPMCVTAPTRCKLCDGAAACGPDAPHCITFNGENRCLSECQPATTGEGDCPAGYTCSAVGARSYCLPESGSCQ